MPLGRGFEGVGKAKVPLGKRLESLGKAKVSLGKRLEGLGAGNAWLDEVMAPGSAPPLQRAGRTVARGARDVRYRRMAS